MRKSVSYYSEKGVKRFINSILFSIAGLKAAWVYEEAFRLYVVIFIVALPLVFWLGESNAEKLILIASILWILIVELVNSAIEAVVDRVGVEYHELAGRAKDLGSAAVMLSIFMAIVSWLVILL